MIRVCIVDDHAVVRRGLKQILSETPDLKVVAEASSAEELVERSKTETWDVTLLDLSMPGRGGLDVIAQIKSDFPKRPVLVLTMHSEDQYAVRVFRAGADGYLTKESIPEKLVVAVRHVAGGRKYINERIAEKLAFEVGPDSGRLPHERLSNREYQVMRMLAEGRTVSEIGEELGLSVKTVSTNRTRLLKKMDIQNNADLIRYAIRQGIVEK